jgi:hypothetical protein
MPSVRLKEQEEDNDASASEEEEQGKNFILYRRQS